MIRLAKWMARSAFGIGCAIGLMTNLSLLPLVEQAQAASAVACDPTWCDPGPSVPQEVRDFITTQCTVHAAIFADQTEPSVSYKFASAITGPGVYKGRNHLDKLVQLDASYAVPLDFKDREQDLYDRGVQASLVCGTLSGSAGSIPVAGLVIQPGNLTPDTGHLLVVASILTQQNLELYATTSRILAGPRVVNTATGTSTPLATLSQAQSLWVSPTDFSTLYCGCNGDGEGVDLACVRQAYNAYQNAVWTANEEAALCLINVMALWSVCMGACAAMVIWGGVGLIGTAICVGVCMAEQVIGTAYCLANLAIKLNSAQRQLQMDLAACGVLVVTP